VLAFRTPLMQIWYLSPFLLALLVWWVATRKHPDEKEKWTWLSLGVCAGAVLMFTLVFLSEKRTTAAGRSVAANAQYSADGPVRVTLQDDRAKEILPATTISRNRTIAVGSLQITLLDVTDDTAKLQIDPGNELRYFGVVHGWWVDASTVSYVQRWWIDGEPRDGDMPGRPFAVDASLGSFLDFGYQGRYYRLGLLETQPPMWGLAPSELHDVLPMHAVIRLVDRGPYSVVIGGPSDTGGARPNGGLTIVPQSKD
jgi:hypothetical protein